MVDLTDEKTGNPMSVPKSQFVQTKVGLSLISLLSRL